MITKWRKLSSGVGGAGRGIQEAVNYRNVVLEEATLGEREQRQHHSQKSQ